MRKQKVISTRTSKHTKSDRSFTFFQFLTYIIVAFSLQNVQEKVQAVIVVFIHYFQETFNLFSSFSWFSYLVMRGNVDGSFLKQEIRDIEWLQFVIQEIVISFKTCSCQSTKTRFKSGLPYKKRYQLFMHICYVTAFKKPARKQKVQRRAGPEKTFKSVYIKDYDS